MSGSTRNDLPYLRKAIYNLRQAHAGRPKKFEGERLK